MKCSAAVCIVVYYCTNNSNNNNKQSNAIQSRNHDNNTNSRTVHRDVSATPRALAAVIAPTLRSDEASLCYRHRHCHHHNSIQRNPTQLNNSIASGYGLNDFYLHCCPVIPTYIHVHIHGCTYVCCKYIC
ncbi:unnamed protein product [Ceratitis capitata]|uniref:(Mediterranean fruit fly) hypothetical protein n=1 Tax=Ceratitis capitata TaxID=7213 RepID=A0A811UYP9_CERCA|nr:unnamed protein product [Ceratitis capitata]